MSLNVEHIESIQARYDFPVGAANCDESSNFDLNMVSDLSPQYLGILSLF
jgi:hypothetical protein